jgi:hypothetical protein
MRLFSCSVACVLLVPLVLGCNTVSPDECWPNTSGGFGGSGTIPIGAGVGATSGGDSDGPSSGTPNPCVTPAPSNSPGDGAEAQDAWISCEGLDALGCMMKCGEAGAACAGRRAHPYKPEVGQGDLYRCKNGTPTHTCSYYFPNGDECIYFSPFGMIPWCVYVGGKP